MFVLSPAGVRQCGSARTTRSVRTRLQGKPLSTWFAGAFDDTVRSPRFHVSKFEVLLMRMRVAPCGPSAPGPQSLFLVAFFAVLTILGSAGSAAAQTGFYPYYNKNNIHYDRFDWHIYTTDHFEIYYYPELEHHLERVAGYAESAYQQISSDLKHDLSFKVPLIIFKTHSEFEQQNFEPGGAQEGVGAFAEPYRDRMLLPIDDPPDLLFGLITHELTHIFQFDIIPQSLIRRSVPLWVNEGHAEYERANWTPFDMMQVRDA